MKGLLRQMTDDGVREYEEVSNHPTIPQAARGVPPLVAAAGVGDGEGITGNTHKFTPHSRGVRRFDWQFPAGGSSAHFWQAVDRTREFSSGTRRNAAVLGRHGLFH